MRTGQDSAIRALASHQNAKLKKSVAFGGFYIIDHHSTTYPHTEPQQQQQQKQQTT